MFSCRNLLVVVVANYLKVEKSSYDNYVKKQYNSREDYDFEFRFVDVGEVFLAHEVVF